jgi:hypothetical protein
MKPWLILAGALGVIALASLPRRENRAQSGRMRTLTKAKKPARKPRAKVLPYGIKPIPLPKKCSTVGDLRDMGDEFGKGADWAVIESAYKSRNL